MSDWSAVVRIDHLVNLSSVSDYLELMIIYIAAISLLSGMSSS